MGKVLRKSSIIFQVHSMGEIAGTQRTSEVENREVQKVLYTIYLLKRRPFFYISGMAMYFQIQQSLHFFNYHAFCACT